MRRWRRSGRVTYCGSLGRSGLLARQTKTGSADESILSNNYFVEAPLDLHSRLCDPSKIHKVVD